jgi:hypothetical protein
MAKLKIFLLLAICMATSASWGQEFYRYKDADGQTVMDSMIPAQYVNGGYDVLNSRGQLIERVPPVQEVDSLEAAQANQIADRALSDQVLLTSYSTVEEIDAHRQRKLLAIEREMSIIETDQRVVQIEIDKAELEVSEYAAEEVPPEVSGHLADLNSTILKLADQLARRQVDMVDIDEEVIGKMDRFRQLKAEILVR